MYIVTKNIPIYPKILTNKQIGATLNLEIVSGEDYNYRGGNLE